MKIRKLQLEGFTCYRKQVEIDFSDLELFAITGATGSGKSSIVDAIIYALYGKVPRVSTDTNSLVSQGLKRMSVLLEFSIGEQLYRIARRTQLKRGTQVILDQEIDGEWQGIASGVRQANQKIGKILGLDYESFIRCIILPQGAFEKFLQDSKSRQEILTRLLNMEILKKMQQRASKNYDNVKDRIARIELWLKEEYPQATPDSLEDLQREYQELDRQIIAATESQEQLQQEFAETKEVFELMTRWQEAKKQYQQHQAHAEKAEQLRQKTEQAKGLLPLLPRLEQLEQIHRRRQKIEEEIAQQISVGKRMASDLRDVEGQLGKAEEELARLPELERRYGELQSISHLATQLDRQREEQREEEKIHANERRRQEQINRQFDASQQQLRSLEKEYERISGIYSELEVRRKVLEKFWQMDSFVEVLVEARKTYLNCEENREKSLKHLDDKKRQHLDITKEYKKHVEKANKLQQKLARLGKKIEWEEILHKIEQAHHLQERLNYQKQEESQEVSRLQSERDKCQKLRETTQKARREKDDLTNKHRNIQKQCEKISALYEKALPLHETLLASEKTKKDSQQEQRQLREQLRQYTREHERVAVDLESFKKQIKQKSATFHDIEGQWQKAYTGNLAHSIRVHLKAKDKCPVCQQTIKKLPKVEEDDRELLEDLERQKQRSQREIRELEKKIAETEANLQSIEKFRHDVDQQVAKVEELLQQIQQGIVESQQRLGELLDCTDPELLSERIEQLRQSLDEANQQEEKLVQALTEKQSYIREQEAVLITLEARMEERKETVERHRRSIAEISKKLANLLGDEQMPSEQEVRDTLTKIKKLEADLAVVESKLVEARLQQEVAEQQYKDAEKNLQKSHQECTRARRVWQEKQKTLREQLDIDVENVEEALQQGIQQYKDTDRQLADTVKHRESLAKQRNESQVQSAKHEAALHEIAQSLEQRQQKLTRLHQENSQLSDKISKATNDQNPQILMSQLKKQQENIESRHRRLREEFLVGKQSLSTQREEVKRLEQNAMEIRSESERIRQELERDLHDLGFSSLEEIGRQRISREVIAQWQREIDEIEARVKDLEWQCQHYQEQLAGRTATHQQVAALEQRLQTCSRDLAQKNENRGRIATKIADMEKDIDQAAKFTKELDELKNQEQILRQLTGDLRANRFQTFVLEHALKTLAEDGSIQLELLSSGRYAFAIEQRDFCIVDHWNEDEIRPVKTLSGGETFIASLSLALALAERIYQLSHRMGANCALESLFLDEGFGTLDDEHLDVVVKALNNLRGTGRTIGIISHLEVLNNYLPARLVVQKHREGAKVVKRA